jgi:hypothetical protein
MGGRPAEDWQHVDRDSGSVAARIEIQAEPAAHSVAADRLAGPLEAVGGTGDAFRL